MTALSLSKTDVDLEYYRKLLGITKDSARADIKKAYRKLAKQWHPDRFYQDLEKHKIAEEKFKEITAAYEYLMENGNESKPFATTDPSTSSTSVNTEKTDPATYYQLGVSLAKRGELEASLKFLGKAIKLYPEYLEALEYRYQVLSELGFEYRAAADRKTIRDLKRKSPQSKTSDRATSGSQQKYNSPNTTHLFKLQKRFSFSQSPIKLIAVDRRRKLLSVTNKLTIEIVQLGSYQKVGKLDLHTKSILSLDLHPKYNWIITAGNDNVVNVFDLDTNQNIASLKKGVFTRKLPKIQTAYFAAEENCSLLISEDKSIRKWNYKENKILYEKSCPITIQSTFINPKRTMLALVGKQKTIRIHEISTGKLFQTLKIQSTATALSFASAGKVLAIATLNKQLKIWNIAKKTVLHQFTGYVGKIIFLQFINAQKHLLSLEKDGVIRIWSLATKAKPLTQVTHLQEITTCQLIDKERTLVIGTRRGDIVLCRIPSLT